MVPRSRLMLYGGLAAFATVGVVASFVHEARVETWRVGLYAPEPVPPDPEFYEMYLGTRDNFSEETRYFGDRWIRSVWRACNTGDLSTDPRWTPPPATAHGQMYLAACLALARRIDETRRIFEEFEGSDLLEASGILTTVLYPAARQGRFEVAGPGMELALEHWPTMESAIFYAAMGRLAIDDLAGAREFFVRYLDYQSSGAVPEQQRAKARELIARNDSVLASRAGSLP